MKVAQTTNEIVFGKKVADVVESVRTFVQQFTVRHYVDDVELGLPLKLPPCNLIYIAVPMSTTQKVAYKSKCKELVYAAISANQQLLNAIKISSHVNKSLNQIPNTLLIETLEPISSAVITTDTLKCIPEALMENVYLKDILQTCTRLSTIPKTSTAITFITSLTNICSAGVVTLNKDITKKHKKKEKIAVDESDADIDSDHDIDDSLPFTYSSVDESEKLNPLFLSPYVSCCDIKEVIDNALGPDFSSTVSPKFYVFVSILFNLIKRKEKLVVNFVHIHVLKQCQMVFNVLLVQYVTIC